MKKMPLTQSIGVKGTFLLTAIFLALMLVLVACGGGSNVPVGTPLYMDPISANNASPAPTEFVQEGYTVWINPEFVAPAGVIRVKEIEYRGCVADAEGNPCIRYIRETDLPLEVVTQQNGESPSSQALLTFRGYGVPVLFLLLVFGGGYLLYGRLRTSILKRDRTYPIKRTVSKIQTGDGTELEPLDITIWYRVDPNPGEVAKFLINTQDVVEDRIAETFIAALKRLSQKFTDDRIAKELPNAVSNLTEADFPKTFLSSYGVVPDLAIVIATPDFPRRHEDTNVKARRREEENMEGLYTYLNKDVRPGEQEKISRAEIYKMLLVQKLPFNALAFKFFFGEGSMADFSQAQSWADGMTEAVDIAEEGDQT